MFSLTVAKLTQLTQCEYIYFSLEVLTNFKVISNKEVDVDGVMVDDGLLLKKMNE